MEIEKEVILLMSQGDEKAYGIIHVFQQHGDEAMHFRIKLAEHDADDVCQIIFEKIWKKRQKFAEIKDFDSYLFILAKYTVINYISTKRVIPIDIDSLPDQCANIASPHEEIVAKDTQLLIDMIVENMPPQRQTIYRMSREQHLKNEEIAQQLGLQKKTVENHLNLALKEIKKALYLMILLQLHWV